MSDAQAEAPAAPAPQPAPAAPSGPTAEQLALEAGWTMAVLYGKIRLGEASGLPTANELQPADRRRLELDRLRHLLQDLAAMPEFAKSRLPKEVPVLYADDQALKEALLKLDPGDPLRLGGHPAPDADRLRAGPFAARHGQSARPGPAGQGPAEDGSVQGVRS